MTTHPRALDDALSDTPLATPRRSLTAALGVLGWSPLDPVLLAALALEAPVLLLGEHGTAKTLLVERVATALGQSFRHYNASLLNYDDLVGIPIPDGTDGGLRFVGTDGAVWGASFVFFDEVNRCRPDLQNKMFPLVHERRIAGVDLTDLRHRWAAMNPPPSALMDDAGYLGADVLDAALADRFWFIVRVPTWSDLTADERLQLVNGRATDIHPDLDLADLIARTRTAIDETSTDDEALVARYVVLLVDALRDIQIRISGRRARLLLRAIIATDAADRLTTPVRSNSERSEQFGAIAELVLRNALPQWCEPEPPSVAQVIGAHVQAWQLAVDERDEVKRRLLGEPDPVRRLKLGLDIGAPDPVVAQLVTSALAAMPTRAEQMGLAVVLSRSCCDRALTPAAWSTIAELATRVLRPTTRVEQVAAGRRLEAWRKASGRLLELEEAEGVDALEYALLNACGAELLSQVPLDRLTRRFRDQCTLFGVTG